MDVLIVTAPFGGNKKINHRVILEMLGTSKNLSHKNLKLSVLSIVDTAGKL